jgi:hypothetical protein
MLTANLFIFDDDEFEVKRVAGTPSIYVKPRVGEAAVPIHFSGRHNALRMMRAVQEVLDTWDAQAPVLEEGVEQ